MVAVLGAMVLWSCSQDEDFEEQMEWSKKAVKKRLSSNRILVKSEDFSFNPTFTFKDNGRQCSGDYQVNLTVYRDTLDPPNYYYETDFIYPPYNPPLEYEKVYPVAWPIWNHVTIVITANCIGSAYMAGQGYDVIL